MPFTMSADSVFDQFKLTISSQGAVNIQAQGIESAKAVALPPQYSITTDGANQKVPSITKLRLMSNQQEVEKLTRPELRSFFEFVEKNTITNYRLVKHNKLWRHVYGVHSKQFDAYNSKTNQKGMMMLEATYCQRCGIILPLRNLTIDHQKPQKGGEIEAMLRVFRAAGLTKATGSGQKNRFLQKEIAGTVGGNTNVLSRGSRGSDSDRYTLTDKGVIYFSALQHYKLTNEMLDMSMHHIVNLRPMCGPCNSGLQNSNVTFCV